MSVCTTGRCPHDRGVFVYLADGPQEGDQDDPRWGRYPWVHDTSAADSGGRLDVCDLMTWALPVECGEMCACGHSSRMHKAADGPIPAGLMGKPRACDCGCPDFRHRPEDLARWRAAEGREPVPAARAASPIESLAPSGRPVQLELFAVEPPPSPVRVGRRGWPLCDVCGASESIGPAKPRRINLCAGCWTPELDPDGAALWDRLRGAARRIETVSAAGDLL